MHQLPTGQTTWMLHELCEIALRCLGCLCFVGCIADTSETEVPEPDSVEYSDEPGTGSSRDHAREQALPDKPPPDAILRVLREYGDAVSACGAEHGVRGGTQVQVKLRIMGASGRLGSVHVFAPHEGMSQCTARVLGEAVFPRFTSDFVAVIQAFTIQ